MAAKKNSTKTRGSGTIHWSEAGGSFDFSPSDSLCQRLVDIGLGTVRSCWDRKGGVQHAFELASARIGHEFPPNSRKNAKVNRVNRWISSLPISIWVFPKIGYPQIIHFNKVFLFSPSILGVFPLLLETPISFHCFLVSTLHGTIQFIPPQKTHTTSAEGSVFGPIGWWRRRGILARTPCRNPGHRKKHKWLQPLRISLCLSTYLDVHGS